MDIGRLLTSTMARKSGELVRQVDEIGDHLEHTLAGGTHRPGNAHQLVAGGRQRRSRAAVS